MITAQWFPLLADLAHVTPKQAGKCAVCGWPLGRGERIARLADGSGWAHVAGCVAQAVT